MRRMNSRRVGARRPVQRAGARMGARPMSRAGFLKGVGAAGVAGAAAMAGRGKSVRATTDDWYVIENGTAADVQAAVNNNYPKIKLVGTFDFGWGMVFISGKNVEILGDNATIRNMFIGFNIANSTVSMENIRFENIAYIGVFAGNSSNCVFKNNTFSGWCFAPIYTDGGNENVYEGNNISGSYVGILAGGLGSSGHVIKNNNISAMLGIRCWWCTGYEIKSNTLTDVSNAGIGLEATDYCVVKGNNVTGNSNRGILLYTREDYPADKQDAKFNVFMGNNIQSTSGDTFSVYFWSPYSSPENIHDNVFIGHGAAVVGTPGVFDYNVVTGVNVQDLTPSEEQSLGQMVQETKDAQDCMENEGTWDPNTKTCTYP
jgi:parallel beta-helix repeat protein